MDELATVFVQMSNPSPPDGTVTHENGHTYPDRYAPGPNAGWALNAAWEILDSIKPGAISIEARSFLAGQIAGRLMKAASEKK